jgi:hypothetical protein
MNFLTMGIGALALGYGIFAGVMRKKNPSSFRNLSL